MNRKVFVERRWGWRGGWSDGSGMRNNKFMVWKRLCYLFLFYFSKYLWVNCCGGIEVNKIYYLFLVFIYTKNIFWVSNILDIVLGFEDKLMNIIYLGIVIIKFIV